MNGVLEFLGRFWFLMLSVVATIGVTTAVAVQGLPIWPFLVVLLGILSRTVVGLANAALKAASESGKWPMFEREYYVSMFASIGLDLLVSAVYFATNEGMLVEVTSLNFTSAFMFGVGGAVLVREGHKAIGNVRAMFQR